jgi:hypothetical protein
MFAFFVAGNFFDFWANKPGDIFLDATSKVMGWNPAEVTLRHYVMFANRPEFFSFDVNGDLLIQDSEGNTLQTVPSTLYVENGNKIKPC